MRRVDLANFCKPGTFLYHVTALENLSLIRERGLLPAGELLHTFIAEEERQFIPIRRKSGIIPLFRNGRQVALVRDQKPLNLELLDACLDKDCSAAEWLAKLDERVFFFTRRSDALGLLRGKTYRDTDRLLIELDRARLIADHAANVEVADINTGVASRVPPKRGHETFQKLELYESEVASRWIKEVTVCGPVSNLENSVLQCNIYRANGVQETCSFS